MKLKYNNFINKLGAFSFLILLTGLINSCVSNLLDTAPYDKIGSGNMWSTENLTKSGVGAMYSLLRDGFNTSGGASGRALYQIDNRLGISGQPRDAEGLNTGTATSSNGLFSSVWKNLYTGVRRTNDAIENIPSSPVSSELKAKFIAEAHFMRAFYYFRLNQVFRGVPVYLEPTELDDMTKPRSSEAEVWQVIIDDLTLAINEPAFPNKYKAGDADYGHATKGAAYALRGKSYLYMKEFAKASADFAKVGECGYSLYSGSFKDLFKEANEQSDEMIFSIQLLGVNGFGADTQFYCGSRSSFGSCWNTYLVSPNIVDMYENIDGTKFDWDDVIPGYNEMNPKSREVYFLRNNLTSGEMNDFAKAGLDMNLYLPDGNEERILAAYANRDPRLGYSVITPYSSYLGAFSGADNLVTSRWPFRTGHEAPGTSQDLRTDTPKFFFYLHRKFVYEGASEILDRVYCPTNFPLIRYADVLLMWAEAEAEASSGVSQKAIELINQVRERAGVASLNSSAATTVTSKEDLIRRLRNERRYEFVNEGIGYFDELRWGTLKETVFFQGNGTKQVWGKIETPYVWIEDNRLNCWAIPNESRQKNPLLTQNPGWED